MVTDIETLNVKVINSLKEILDHGHGVMTVEVSTMGDRRVSAVLGTKKTERQLIEKSQSTV